MVIHLDALIQMRKCLSHLAAAYVLDAIEENTFILYHWISFPAGGSHFLQGEVPSH